MREQKTKEYLTAIYLLSSYGPVRGAYVAREMKLSRPTVSVALQTLAQEGYLTVDAGHIVCLTEKGKRMAKEAMHEAVQRGKSYHELVGQATEESETFRDISSYNTKELPHINDFKWVTPEILNGVCPDEAEILYFEETLGGWKCYIIENETEVERLANMELTGGTMEEMQLRVDWYYIRSGGKDGEVYEDNSPDSVFEGYVNDDGEIEAEGPGRIRVTDIYVIGDHMYAFGTISWPDGISGSLLLVRP